MKKLIILLLFFYHGFLLTGQTEFPAAGYENADSLRQARPIVTDRPTQTISSSTVPRGTFQIETGFIFETTKDIDYSMDNWYLGTTLLRYGVWNNFEIRLGSHYQITNYELSETGSDSTAQGFGPLMTGFKVFIVEEKGLRPEIAIVAEMTLRHIGSLSYRPTFSHPVAKVAATHTLARNLSLGYNAGFAYNGETADGFFVYSGMLGYGIGSSVSAFAEVYGTFDHGNHPNHRIDGGFTFLVRRNLQLDLSFGTGFDNHIDKSFVSTGLSWRIPR